MTQNVKCEEMTEEKRTRVLDAALEAFMRYGYRRVTMGDIAREAGMSRPALYLVFPNKEEIFKAAIAGYAHQAAEEIRSGLSGHSTVADRLALAFDVWTVRPFEMVQLSPDARELTECAHGFARDVLEDSYRQFEEILASIIDPMSEALGRHGLTPDRVARIAATSARGFKASAADTDALRELISGLISMIVALGEPAPAG
jgi:AcrR family transcriptional regulator